LNKSFEELIKPLPNILNRAAQDFHDACQSWAYWEAGNSYPIAGHRAEFHRKLNKENEGHHLREVQRQSFVCTIFALCRMLDSVDDKRRTDRESLHQVSLVLKCNNFSLEHLARENNLPLDRARRLYSNLRVLLLNDDPSKRNISQLKPKLFDLRNDWLAHSLQNPKPSRVNPVLIRDGLVFCGQAIKLSRLLFAGLDWSPRYSWRKAIRNAQDFWNRHERGYDLGP
jgi:hypothetical protein